MALKMKERLPRCHVSCWNPTRVVSTRTVVPERGGGGGGREGGREREREREREGGGEEK